MMKQRKEITVYIAEDWTEFLTTDECLLYEHNVTEFKKDIKYFKCLSEFNDSIGKWYLKTLYFIVHSKNLHLYRVIQYLFIKYKGLIKGSWAWERNEWSIPEEISEEIFIKETKNVGPESFSKKIISITKEQVSNKIFSKSSDITWVGWK